MLRPEDLVGTWEMVEYYLEKDGERVYPLGEDCKGFLMYTPDGYVSAQQMATGVPRMRAAICTMARRRRWPLRRTGIWRTPAAMRSRRSIPKPAM